MVIADEFIYLELQKTGCTFTRTILDKVDTVDAKIIGKHNTYKEVPSTVLGDFESKVKVGNIRNPWDWYVSLWAYGCLKRGGFYSRVSQKPDPTRRFGIKRYLRNPAIIFQSTRKWKKLYRDAENPDLFRNWLKLLLTNDSIDVGEGYHAHVFPNEVGLLTFRYLKLYTYEGGRQRMKIKDYSSVLHHDDKANFMDVIIKNENIPEYLKRNASKIGIKERDLVDVLEDHENRINTSKRRSYQFYYDEESIELVADKERFIIDKYGYDY